MLVGATPKLFPSNENPKRFKSCFGASAEVLARVFQQLEEFDIDTERNLDSFLLCCFWLKNYDTEMVLAVRFGMSEKEIRRWLWFYAECLKELSTALIRLIPEDFDDRIALPMVVDGTHCMIYEPMHDLYPMDSDYYSHKHHTACYAYQVTISTTESKILSLHGPYPAGKYNDKVMWKESGVQDLMVDNGKRAIADGGYEGVPGVAVPIRRYHSQTTNIYFRRNRARVERTMGFLKNFRILANTFRVRKNRLIRHEQVFRAVGAIVATQLKEESSLFDV